MNSDFITTMGLQTGRDWESLPADEGPLEWTLDHRQGLIQGPLDLEFLRGRKISLTLEPGQMAMLIQDGDLKAVYLDGAHYLDIGHGNHQVPAESSIIFLAVDRHINLNWSHNAPCAWARTGTRPSSAAAVWPSTDPPASTGLSWTLLKCRIRNS